MNFDQDYTYLFLKTKQNLQTKNMGMILRTFFWKYS